MSASTICPHCRFPLEVPDAVPAPLRLCIEGIIEALITLKNDLEAEKRSIQRLWASREMQLERAVSHTAGLYEELGGILGSSLRQIGNREIPVIDVVSDLLALEPLHADFEHSAF